MKEQNKKTQANSRRSFLKQGAVAASIFIVPRHVLGGVGYLAPSDRLHLAAIGAGGKGASDIMNASVNGREKVVALCDVDFAGSAKRSIENFPKAKLYSDFRVMLEKKKESMPLPSQHRTMFMVQPRPSQWTRAFMYTFKNH